MSPPLRALPRNLTPFAACLGLALLAGVPCRAAPKPLTPEEQARVDRAIEKGIAFLKSTQREEGGWAEKDRPLPRGMRDWTKPLEYALLPGLALLESGVPADDPCVQKVAELLRRNTGKLNQTYGVSLGVLFLDRLGEDKDEELIQDLALRLVASQGYSGGWGYRCLCLSKKNRDDLGKTLHDLPEGEATGSALGQVPSAKVPPALRRLAVFRPPSELLRPAEPHNKQYVLYQGTTDNSNTQFALLALWAAARHGVPVGRSLRLAALRFRLTQQRDGNWPYYYPTGGWRTSHRSSRAMTTVGLLGLAIGRGLETAEGDKPAPDRQVLAGFAALSHEVGEPAGQMELPIPLPETYFLWSVERVAVLYRLREVGGKDWYRWGAEILVSNQAKDGSWPAEWATQPEYRVELIHVTPACVRTSFALLFLKRSNLTKDLTKKLPFKPEELNKGIIAACAGGVSGSPPSPGQSESKH